MASLGACGNIRKTVSYNNPAEIRTKFKISKEFYRLSQRADEVLLTVRISPPSQNNELNEKAEHLAHLSKSYHLVGFFDMNLEQLTPQEFESHIAQGTFRLAFVGMSNVGKSYRSRILRDECDFFWYHVDGEIRKTLVFDSMDGISNWLGLPNTQGYAARAAEYLAAEDKHTKVDFLDTEGKNLVFDTTGSVIYLPEATHTWLRENCLIVNIDAGEGTIAQMMESFLLEPKPLIWQDFFQVREGESERETLERCYPNLLADRLKRYRALAHITIPVAELYDKNGKETLAVIETYLERVRQNASQPH